MIYDGAAKGTPQDTIVACHHRTEETVAYLKRNVGDLRDHVVFVYVDGQSSETRLGCDFAGSPLHILLPVLPTPSPKQSCPLKWVQCPV